MSERTPNKPRKMIDHLRERIVSGELRTGARLPAIRELMESFSLSYGSVKRGIDYLQEIGLVEKRIGSGTFVRQADDGRTAKTNHGVVAVFMSRICDNPTPGIYNTVLLGIQKEAERQGVSLLINYLDLSAVSHEAIEGMSKPAAGMIFLSEYDHRLNELSFKIPAVGVCMHRSVPGNISIIDIDPYSCASLAAEYFSREKMKKVIVVFDERPAYKNRCEEFIRLWREMGNQVECFDRGDMPTLLKSLFSPAPAFKTRRGSKNGGKRSGAGKIDAQTGYLFVTGSLLQELSLQHLESCGEAIGKRQTVLGIDGKNRIDPTFHPAPTIWTDWQQAGALALGESLCRIRNPGAAPKRIYLPGWLRE